jgi:hypothetical protein
MVNENDHAGMAVLIEKVGRLLMSKYLCSLAVVAFFLCLAGVSARSEEKKEETVENPYYKFWSGSKVGSTAVSLETTKFGNADSKQWTPEGVSEKRITYKLVDVRPEHVVVEMVVTEREFLGFVQSAPTRYIYPAKVRKEYLDRFLQSTGAKNGEETLKVMDKDMKVRTVAGKIKGSGDEETDYKIWLSDEVPGSVVKKVRTTRHKGEVIAETTIVLETYKKAE